MVGTTSKIHDVLIAHHGLPHVLPLTVHLKNPYLSEFAKKKLIIPPGHSEEYSPMGLGQGFLSQTYKKNKRIKQFSKVFESNHP